MIEFHKSISYPKFDIFEYLGESQNVKNENVEKFNTKKLITRREIVKL